MFCQSCGAKLPDDANFCSNCGVRLKTNNVIEQREEVLFKCPVRRSKGEYEWESAQLTITNKKVRVRWDTGFWGTSYKRTEDTPLSWIKGVELKKGGWFSGHELTIYGVGLFDFAKYEDAARAAELINSLT